MIDIGSGEEIGYADVIRNGKSREENRRLTIEWAKKHGIKINIKYVDKPPKGSVILDTRTGRCMAEDDFYE